MAITIMQLQITDVEMKDITKGNTNNKMLVQIKGNLKNRYTNNEIVIGINSEV